MTNRGMSRRAASASLIASAFGLGIGVREAQARHSVWRVPGAPALSLADYDLGELGFVVEEYFMSGEATAFRMKGEAAIDGRWVTEPGRKASYTTRLVVVRPRAAARFNGTAVVEWLNVSALRDGAPDWIWPHREYLRGGYIWVGVSAQRLGIYPPTGESTFVNMPSGALKVTNPERYRELEHPGDAFSYDIYTQAGRLVRQGSVTGGLKARRLLAAGESQSAGRLIAYVDGVHLHARTYGGFLIHSRGGGRPLDMSATRENVVSAFVRPLLVRTDLKEPVLQLVTETDLASFYASRQADTDRLRTWEIAGTAHADSYGFSQANSIDDGRTPPEVWGRAMAPTDVVMGQKAALPMNSNPAHKYVAMSAVRHLDNWVRGRSAPPAAAPIQSNPPAAGGALDASHLVVDSHGIAKGGIRTPWVDAPVARMSGFGNSGPGFARLVGVTELFSKAKLAALYPRGKADYLQEFNAALDRSVAAGFILEDDRVEASALAAAMWPG